MSITIILETNIIMFLLDILINKLIDKTHFFKQFTIWNLYVLCKYQTPASMYTSIYIFIIFHTFFFLETNILHNMLTKNNINLLTFHLINIILHIIPAIYSIYKLYSYDIRKDIHTTLEIGYFFTSWVVLIGNYYNIYSLSIQTQHYIMTGVYIINSIHNEKMIAIL
jgi:hypothetical protein